MVSCYGCPSRLRQQITKRLLPDYQEITKPVGCLCMRKGQGRGETTWCLLLVSSTGLSHAKDVVYFFTTISPVHEIAPAIC